MDLSNNYRSVTREDYKYRPTDNIQCATHGNYELWNDIPP